MTKELEPEIMWVDSLTMVPGIGGERGKFDIVMMAYVMTELQSPNAREQVIEALFS